MYSLFRNWRVLSHMENKWLNTIEQFHYCILLFLCYFTFKYPDQYGNRLKAYFVQLLSQMYYIIWRETTVHFFVAVFKTLNVFRYFAIITCSKPAKKERHQSSPAYSIS